MMVQIKNRFPGAVIAEGDTVRDAAEANRANLNGASLNRANLNGANLNGASLNRANLNGASLDGASLNGASLNGASLDGANLNGASLDGANLNRAKGVVTSGTSPRGYSHWAWIKSGAIVYRAGCKMFANADEYRTYYASPVYAEEHGALSAAVSLALCEMNIDLAAKLLDQQEAA